jgi:hypothetical protein
MSWGASLWCRTVAVRRGLGRRREGGGGEHLSSTRRSSGYRNKGMNVNLEAVEEGHGVVLFYRPGEGAGRTGRKRGSAVGGE